MPFLFSDKLPPVNQLRYFATVAHYLSYRRAALQLGISQPTLTSQINTLESQLGFSLFERSRSGTLLSAQGRALLPVVENILRDYQTLQETARDIAEGQKTTYRLGIPPTLGPYLLPYVLPDIHYRYSELKFYVREGSPGQLEQGLLNGEYDLILLPTFNATSQLIIEPLFTEPLKFVMPSDHELAGIPFIDPESLRGEQVLTLEDTHHFHYQVQEICQSLGANVQRDFEGTSLDTLRQMVVMGMGVSFLPGLYVHSELHRPEALHVCELADMPISRQHGLAWRNTSPGRVFFRELVSEIKAIINKNLSGIVRVD